MITENNKNPHLHVLDYGSGHPVILIHGWPLSSKSWEYQIPALVDNGFRAIAYDRKGFGQSYAPWESNSCLILFIFCAIRYL